MSNKFETDIINKRFKNCIVIKHCGYIKGSKARKSIYECLCDCGKIFVADRTFLTNRTKNHRSCGCKKFKFGPNHTAWQGHGLISKDLWTQLQRGAKIEILNLLFLSNMFGIYLKNRMANVY